MFRSIIVLTGLCLVIAACDDAVDRPGPVVPRAAETTIQGKVAVKTRPRGSGVMAIVETLQPQYLVTIPKREIVWFDGALREESRYTPPEGWTLVDAVVHASGHTSAVIVRMVQVAQEVKLLRFTPALAAEFDLAPIPGPAPSEPVFVATLDRVRLAAHGDDVFAVVRWSHNHVQAHRVSYAAGRFSEKWVSWVEPPAYLSTTGIIGGGFDNFRQGDYDHHVYCDVDDDGNLYAVVPSSEEVLVAHDPFFGDDLLDSADPSIYEFGVAVVTKLSPAGERLSCSLSGNSLRRNKRMLAMRVSGDDVYLAGRVRQNSNPDGWDAWVMASDGSSGVARWESIIDFKGGDMFWDIEVLPDGRLIGAGTTGYTQNPSGQSVSDSREAMVLLLDRQGRLLKSLEVPQGPAARGSEAMSAGLLDGAHVIISGAHNAPGTHAEVYGDGFLAFRGF